MKCDACPVKHIQLHACPYPCAIADGKADWQVGRVEFGQRADDAKSDFLFRYMMFKRNNDIDLPKRKGWICPKCDNAVSPDEKVCPVCKQKRQDERNDDGRTHIRE